MDLFNLMATLSLDDGGFTKGLKGADKAGKNFANKLEKSFNRIAKVAKTVFAGYVTKTITKSIWNLANATAQLGDTIDKQSQVLGLSRKAYQQWDYVLGQSGASIDSMSRSMKTMNALIADAGEDGEEAKKAFKELGIDLNLLSQMPVEHQFNYIVTAFQKLPQGANKSALALKVFGQNGYELLPLLNTSSEAMGALVNEAEEYGMIMSDEAVDASVKFGDSLDKLKRTFTGFKSHLMEKVLPVLTKAFDRFSNYIMRIREAFDAKGFKGAWEEIKSILSEELKESAVSFSSLIGLTDENGNVLGSWSDIGKEIAGKLMEKVQLGGMITKLLTFTARNAALIVGDVVNVITDPTVIQGLVSAAEQLVDAAVAILSDPATWDAVKQILTSIVNGLVELWANNPTVAAIVSAFGAYKITKTVSNASNMFSNMFL